MSAPGPRISVVVATYNGSPHITEQLASITAQTLAPVEIIVTDDGSTDGTLDRVGEFAERSDVPIESLQNAERLGYPENFLRAALRACGDLIAFSDQDDVWLEDKLSRAAAAFRDPSVTQWVHASQLVDDALRPWPDPGFHTGLAKRAARADPLQPLHGSHSVFRAELLRYLPPVDRPASVYGPHPAEHDEWIKFAALVLGRIAWDRRPAMLYRRHDTALTRTAPIPPRTQVLRGIDEHRDINAIRAGRERHGYLIRRADAAECAPVRHRVVAASDRYQRLIPRLTRRVQTRRSPTRAARGGALLAGAARGDYGRPAAGGLGLWALVQDVYAVASSAHASGGDASGEEAGDRFH